jgi:coenzyme F420-reducing hydrogenase alpha subunit
MSEKITLQKATRIEGNADIQIQVQDGRVESARFMVQDFRGFEKMTQGKQVTSVPHMVSRICGLCSTAHQVAGLRAIEDALGVEVPASVRKLREIAIWGEWIASHALSYYFLTLPDALGAGRGVFDLMQEHPDVARNAFFLRRAGDRIVEIVGKRPVHAVALGIGRLNVPPTPDELDEIRRIASEVLEMSHRLIAGLDLSQQPEAQLPFPAGHSVNLLSYDSRPGRERFQVHDRAGELQGEFDRETFGERVSEMRVDWSLAKFPYLTELGFPDGILLVGPLSRLTLEGGVLDDLELAGCELTRWLGDPAARSLDSLDECRLLELSWAARQILRHIDEVDLGQMEAGDVDLEGSGWGIGVVEAPRGVLVHNYTVNRGAMERMRLLVATQFNNAYINLVLQDLAERHVDGDGLTEEGEQVIARCVRVFDPCLTCATH